jgi:hypothetical protein
MPKSRKRPRAKNSRSSSPPSSRERDILYTRARSLASLLAEPYQSDDIFRSGFEALREIGAPMAYRSVADVDRAEPLLLTALDSACRPLSAYWMLPAIHQFVVDHYDIASRTAHSRYVSLAPFKLMAARVFASNLTQSPPRWPTQHSVLKRALALALTYDQITKFRYLNIVDSQAAITAAPDGFDHNAAALVVANAMTATYAAGGQVQRFANETTPAMFRYPEAFLADVWRVLAGDQPMTRPTFQNSHLRDFPDAIGAPGFWYALAARLQLLLAAQRASTAAGSTGLAILKEGPNLIMGPPLFGTTPVDIEGVQRATLDAFWSPSHPPTDEYAVDQFVFRPIARLARDCGLFVTSTLTIADSITTLTEEAVSPTYLDPAVALPASNFERLLSGPFEASVVELLRDAGFIAGEVTKSGSWHCQGGPVSLRAPTLVSGQIDFLAWRTDGLVLIGECKVLQLPVTTAAWVNQWHKIGPDDAEGFRRKLRLKANWSADAIANLNWPVSEIVKLIVLDRPLHLGRPGEDDVLVTDQVQLRAML